jgi:hypothetical protein
MLIERRVEIQDSVVARLLYCNWNYYINIKEHISLFVISCVMEVYL